MKQRKDYSGKIYGILHVKKWSEEKQAWLCKCECGNIKYCSSATLKKGKIKSCGCLSKQEIVWKKFGRLLVIKDAGYKDKYGNRYYTCLCDCGQYKDVTTHGLHSGSVRSCGCLADEARKTVGKKYGPETAEKNCVEGTNIKNLTIKIRKDNSSGCKGVSWDGSRNKWSARIAFKGRNYNLGRYNNKEDAVNVRKTAEKKIFEGFLEYYENLNVQKKRGCEFISVNGSSMI